MVKQWSLAILCAFCCTVSQAEDIKKKPVVYLTFDDGPSSDRVTDMVLDVLAKHNAHATFFVTGSRARANPEKIRNIVAEGHALGNHTLSHPKLPTLFDYDIAGEFIETNSYVYDAGGPPLHCFRAPFGATDDRVNDIALGLGLRKVGWSIDTRDWDPYVDPEQIGYQLEDSHDGSIVLMHDGPASRWKTLEVFTTWMNNNADIYSFEALPQCVQPVVASYASLDLPIGDLLPLGKLLTVDGREEAKPKVVQRQAVVMKAPKAVVKAVVEVPQDVAAEVQALTVEQLLEKLRSYEISLQPEVVAQSSIKNANFFGAAN